MPCDLRGQVVKRYSFCQQFSWQTLPSPPSQPCPQPCSRICAFFFFLAYARVPTTLKLRCQTVFTGHRQRQRAVPGDLTVPVLSSSRLLNINQWMCEEVSLQMIPPTFLRIFLLQPKTLWNRKSHFHCVLSEFPNYRICEHNMSFFKLPSFA